MHFKRTVALLLSSAFLLGGCAGTGETASSDITSLEESVSSSSESSVSETSSTEEVTSLDFLTTATENQYDGLEFTASLANRMAVLPGEIFGVAISVQNTGEETISYTLGAGTNTTPDAIVLEVPGLQTILPEDHLGLSTRDYQVVNLEPGASLKYTLNAAAIEPQDTFDELSLNLYTADGTYIGNFSADELKKADPTLTPAATGSYTGTAYFAYTVLTEDGSVDAFSGPTGYATSDFSFTIS